MGSHVQVCACVYRNAGVCGFIYTGVCSCTRVCMCMQVCADTHGVCTCTLASAGLTIRPSALCPGLLGSGSADTAKSFRSSQSRIFASLIRESSFFLAMCSTRFRLAEAWAARAGLASVPALGQPRRPARGLAGPEGAGARLSLSTVPDARSPLHHPRVLTTLTPQRQAGPDPRPIDSSSASLSRRTPPSDRPAPTGRPPIPAGSAPGPAGRKSVSTAPPPSAARGLGPRQPPEEMGGWGQAARPTGGWSGSPPRALFAGQSPGGPDEL